MICGVYTRLMSVRESTSIELPSALSGSNVLMAWPGVTSTRTVDWANAAVASTVNSNAIWADFRATFMVETKSDPHLEERNRDCGRRGPRTNRIWPVWVAALLHGHRLDRAANRHPETRAGEAPRHIHFVKPEDADPLTRVRRAAHARDHVGTRIGKRHPAEGLCLPLGGLRLRPDRPAHRELLIRSNGGGLHRRGDGVDRGPTEHHVAHVVRSPRDRKSTRLNSSH